MLTKHNIYSIIYQNKCIYTNNSSVIQKIERRLIRNINSINVNFQ
jgi:hypothetical protein